MQPRRPFVVGQEAFRRTHASAGRKKKIHFFSTSVGLNFFLGQFRVSLCAKQSNGDATEKRERASGLNTLPGVPG